MDEVKSTKISRVELVALIAMLAATVAFSIDAMLPVLPEIAEALTPENPNQAQLVIATFVVGLGVGTLFAGPLSDAYGRKTVATWGAVIYVASATVAALAQNIETMLIARVVQGLGASGPRVVALAILRDLFSGRQMAKVTSFVMTVFALVPVIAPSMGAAIGWAFGWRAIFLSFALFSILTTGWLLIRQEETLAKDARRPFRFGKIKLGVLEIARNRQVLLAISAQTFVFSMLFVMLMTSQQIFGVTFGRGASFPLWFGLCAAISSISGLLNAAIVVRLGMRKVLMRALGVQSLFSLVFIVSLTTIDLAGTAAFAVFFVWMVSVFFMAGMGIGNLNSIALEPMGHMAGLAASIVTATSTVFSMAIAIPISQAFDGTPLPSAIGVLAMSSAALICVRMTVDAEAT